MTPNTIELTPDGRIMAYEMPDFPAHINQFDPNGEAEYLTLLEAAKRDAVYFKPDDYAHVIHQLFNDLIIDVSEGESFEQGKPYPVPDGYEVKTKLDCICGFPLKHEQCMEKKVCESKLIAILVPKEEV
jgi:hypothetical protein